nr:4726_t:CDS:2 [Entrophospora candida]
MQVSMEKNIQKFPDVKIKLPKNNLITVHKLVEKYPDKLKVKDTNDNIHEAIHKNSQKVFYTESDSEHSKRINQELIDTKYKKAAEVRVNTLRVVDLPDRCAIVGQTNFQAFYGYTFAIRAQFSAANDKIHINSARSYQLKLIRGIGPTIAEKIEPERKRKFSDTMDDLLERVPKFPRSERFIML